MSSLSSSQISLYVAFELKNIMMRKILTFLAYSCLLWSFAFGGSIQSSLVKKINTGETTSAILELPQVLPKVLLSLKTQNGFDKLGRNEKVPVLISSLKEDSEKSQAKYVSALSSLGLEYETFWASNVILVKGLTPKVLSHLIETIEGGFVLREEVTVSVPAPNLSLNISQEPQWGVVKIGAPEAWAYTQGENVIVGLIDTGVNLNHVALRDGYAGIWSDPYYSTALPTDQHGHGSHMCGIAVGRTNGIGVAPMAKWGACRGLNHQGSGSEAALLTCGEFMVKASPMPNIVAIGWSGSSGQTFFDNVISMWRASGIIPVVAASNSGPSCRTIGSPGDNPNVITVAATNNLDTVLSSTGRGPNADGIMKPDFGAPGVNIVSAGTGTSNYVTMTGSAMASHNFAGAAALVISKNPHFTFDDVYNAFASTSVQRPLSDADRRCGLHGPGDYPNNYNGWGLINVAEAIHYQP